MSIECRSVLINSTRLSGMGDTSWTLYALMVSHNLSKIVRLYVLFLSIGMMFVSSSKFWFNFWYFYFLASCISKVILLLESLSHIDLLPIKTLCPNELMRVQGIHIELKQ